MKALLVRAWHGWREIGVAIGDFQARLLLTVFYFSIASVFGIVLRLIGDPLRMRPPHGGTAWIKRQDDEPDISKVRRQF